MYGSASARIVRLLARVLDACVAVVGRVTTCAVFSSMYAWDRSVESTVASPCAERAGRRRSRCRARPSTRASAVVVVRARDAVAAHGDAVVRDVDPLGSRNAPLAPSSESTRPQYGSSPLSEHCTSWLLATAARGAARVVGRAGAAHRDARRTSSRPRRRRPSARRASSHTAVSASTSAWSACRSSRSARRPPRRWRARARCRWCSCSRRRLRQLNVSRDRARERALQRRGLDGGVGGETASIVAIAGASIAAPLAMPPTERRAVARSASASASLRTVSVVSIAVPRRPPRAVGAQRRAHSFGMPDSTGAIGIGMPMRPVEHTSTSSVATPSPSAGELAHAAARRRGPARRWPRWRCRS